MTNAVQYIARSASEYSRVAATECSPTRQRGDPVDRDFTSSVGAKDGSEESSAPRGANLQLNAYPTLPRGATFCRRYAAVFGCASRDCCRPFLWEVGNLARGARQLQNVHTRVRPVHDIDVAAVVHFDIVGLDCHLAALVCARSDAALIGFGVYSRDVITDFLWIKGITNVEGAHTGIEVRDEEHALVIDRCEVLV